MSVSIQVPSIAQQDAAVNVPLNGHGAYEYIDVLAWPIVVIVSIIVFKREVARLLSRVVGAKLPGGVELSFQDSIKEAKELQEVVDRQPASPASILSSDKPRTLNDANKRLLELGLRPSPSGLSMSYYRDLVSTADPNIALAGLRIEIEALAENLAKAFEVDVGERKGAGILLRKLRSAGAITTAQFSFAMTIVELCNRAVHGEKIVPSQAYEVIDLAESLAKQYVDWLNWGFDSLKSTEAANPN